MPILRRIRNRLGGRGRAPDSLDSIWPEVEPYAKEAFQRISVAFVASWEVASSALYRQATINHSKEKATTLVGRFSDGLVPTTEGLSAIEHQFSGVWRLSAQDGDLLISRLPRLRTLLSKLGPQTSEGWAKTLDYIEPVFSEFKENPVQPNNLVDLGARIQSHIEREISNLLEDLGKLKTDSELERNMVETFLRFGDACSRAIEIELDEVRSFIQSN